MDYQEQIDDINQLVKQDLKNVRDSIDVKKSKAEEKLQEEEQKIRSDFLLAPEELRTAEREFLLKIQQIKAHGVDNGRNKKIIRVSVNGILINITLSVFKATVGLFAHSIAIVMDAVNNVADACAALITIIGTKLSMMDPDEKHPFGYGRIEYLSAMVISVLVLYAGFSSFAESVDAIRHPKAPAYTPVTLLIVAAAVLVKIISGRYIRHEGEKLNSDSLVDIGRDSMLDAAITATTLVAAVFYLRAGISLEAWLGALISLGIIKSGASMMGETFSRILGERADVSLAKEIRATILKFEEVSDVCDLVLNNYGPDTFSGSVHVTVPDTLSAARIDELSRRIIYEVYTKHGVALTAVGIYSLNTQDQEAVRVRNDVVRLALEEPYVTQVQGFYYSAKTKTIRCDIVVGFSAPDRKETCSRVVRKIQEHYPDYILLMALSSDFSDETA